MCDGLFVLCCDEIRTQVTWEWKSFTSTARTDNLALKHWVKVSHLPRVGACSASLVDAPQQAAGKRLGQAAALAQSDPPRALTLPRTGAAR